MVPALLAWAAWRKVGLLRDVLPAPEGGARAAPGPPEGPALSVIVTALNEAEAIESTVRSLLAQHGAPIELLVVDDRSTDATGAILDRIAAEPAAAGRLVVEHVDTLPDGWIGKCHACHAGAARARGDWLLFLDGDVSLLRGDLLASLLRHVEGARLDHVAVIPDQRPMAPLQTALVAVFGQMFLIAARAWEMDRDRPRGGAGIGAFNLVRRAAYARIGGHERLRMDPADDFKLGRLLKESGARQRLYDGLGLVRCFWHRGAWNVVRGLEKNFFAGFDYSIVQLVAFTAAAVALVYGPLFFGVRGVLLGAGGAALVPVLAQSGLVYAAAALHCRRSGGRRAVGAGPLRLALLYPAAAGLLLIAAWNSSIRTLRRGGIDWRGTFYPLAALRRGRVRPGAGRITEALGGAARRAGSALSLALPLALWCALDGAPGRAAAPHPPPRHEAPAPPAALTEAATPAGLDAIVRRAQEVQDSDLAAWLRHRFRRVAHRFQLDADGGVADEERLEFLVTPSPGHTFDERLVLLDGREPSAREIERHRRSALFTRHFSTMIEGDGGDGAEGGYSLRHLLSLASYRFVGLEHRDGVPCLRLDFGPGGGTVRGRGLSRKFVEAMSGSLWLTEQGLHLKSARARTVRPVGFALATSKIHHLHVEFEAAPVEDGTWLPRRVEILTEGRILMVPLRKRNLYLYSEFSPASG